MELQEAIEKAKARGVNLIKQLQDGDVPAWGNTEEWKAIHYTGVHAKKFAGVYNGGYGARYSVDWDGNQYEHCSKGAVLWAVGTGGCYKQKHPNANNRTTASIELCCKNDVVETRQNAGPEWYIPEETLIAGAALAAYLLKRDGQGVEHLVRHYDIVNKTCPAPMVHDSQTNGTWTWAFFVAVVQGVLEDIPEPTHTVQVSTGRAGLVTTDNLNVRTAPGGSVVKTVPTGTALYPIMRTYCSDLWFKDKDGWFSGKFVTGWVYDQGNKWWYLNHGQYAVGWKLINGSWYYFNEAGWMQIGWQQLGGEWYFMDTDGVMATGWQRINGEWYFLDTDGHMLHDQWAYNRTSKIYYWLQSDGRWDGKTIQDPDQWKSTEY